MTIGSLIVNGFTGFLGLYLAFTNSLSGFITTTFNLETTEYPTEVTEIATTDNLTEIPSKYEYGSALPQILIDNAGYQQAALSAANQQDPTAPPDLRSPTERVRDALVNIFCQYETDTYRRTTTGTGFFISHRGVILTNAHVAQYLLLKEVPEAHDVQCTIRVGNPAVATYEAELLYLPPTWVSEHAQLLTEEKAAGTGERDYALLYVARGLNNQPVPAYFPSVTIDTNLLPRSTEGIEVLAAGYPAELLFELGMDADLSPVVASSTVLELYTFGSNYADIFSIASSKVGEHGASGGVVTRADGSAIGLISTKGNIENEGEHSLRAITLSYVDRTITQETGFSLADTMRGDLAFRSSVYKNALVPFLAKLLAFNLE